MSESVTLPASAARAGLSATVSDGRVFVCGGHDGESPVKTLEAFEPGPEFDSPGVWSQMPAMLARRTYLQTVCLDGRIFAIGGSADGRTLNTIEVFDPTENSWGYWFTMPPMHTKRTLHGAAVGNGRIFVCGGFDGMRDMNTTECYDPRANAWQTKSTWNLKEGRSYLALCTCQGFIYAIGGQDRRRETGPRAHHSVEAFDLYSERWFDATPLGTGRLGLSASHLVHPDGDDYVYACGGSDGSDVLASVERFNVRQAQATLKVTEVVQGTGRDRQVIVKEVQREKSDDLTLAENGDGSKFTLIKKNNYPAQGGYFMLDGLAGGQDMKFVVQPVQVEFSIRYYLKTTSGEYIQLDKETRYVTTSRGNELGGGELEVDIHEGTWSPAPSMSTPRLGHAAAVVNNKLYVIGGYDGKEPLDTFECFDPELEKWSPPMKMGALPLALELP
jgi:hypothetical protein